jgi:multiple sugar transport system permease protein
MYWSARLKRRLSDLLTCLAAAGALAVFGFPVFYLVLTALRPPSEAFYVLKGSQVTLENFVAAWATPSIQAAFANSALLATFSTVLSLAVTVPSGYMLARFSGWLQRWWFGVIYLVRTVPYIAWILPLFVLIRRLGLYDSLVGVLIPHMVVHITFFSWVMRGFFKGIPPDTDEAAQVDGCSPWAAFLLVTLPQAVPGIVALFILGWLWSWSEFLFALILTTNNTPLVTVITAQFIHEMGIQWSLMAATSVLALIPAAVAVAFTQRYIVQGLRI